VYPHYKVHIDIGPNTKTRHLHPYPVHCIYLSTFKKLELDHIVQLGIIVPQQGSEWASSPIIISKKDGSVCWMHQLNKVIKCKQYPLPIITHILHKHIGRKFLLNLSPVCNTLPMNRIRRVKIAAPSQLLLGSRSTPACLWVYNVLLTLLKQSW
jgi:hypothetical protein